MPYPQFDRSRLIVQSLSEREHDLDLSAIMPLDAEIEATLDPAIERVAERCRAAHEAGRPVIVALGAHVLRAGVQRFIIDLMVEGIISHVAVNGAGAIHDFEFALIGATTESVARYIRTGEFGLWRETGRLNALAGEAVEEGIGYGEAIGRALWRPEVPHRDISVLAAGYRHKVPVTVHVGIGYDITHELPNCDGAALGQASYTDFLVFAEAVSHLEGGAYLTFGSAVMGPEVYLKALSMARNVARQEGREIAHFTTAVFDLHPLPSDYHAPPGKHDPNYYFRPWKTILVRTVADGGESFYVQGDHAQTFPALHRAIMA